jgi:hypothetical protein
MAESISLTLKTVIDQKHPKMRAVICGENVFVFGPMSDGRRNPLAEIKNFGNQLTIAHTGAGETRGVFDKLLATVVGATFTKVKEIPRQNI